MAAQSSAAWRGGLMPVPASRGGTRLRKGCCARHLRRHRNVATTTTTTTPRRRDIAASAAAAATSAPPMETDAREQLTKYTFHTGAGRQVPL